MATLASKFVIGVKSIFRPQWRTLALPLAAFTIVFVLWQMAWSSNIAGLLLYPFRLFVSFVHESGHGLAAILTGGRFIELQVSANGGGLATTQGGNPLLILPMGYLGAALFGAILLYAANRVERVKLVAAAVGVFCVICALFFTSNGQVVAFVGIPLAAGFWYFSMRITGWAKALRLAALITVAITLILVSREVALMVGIVAGVGMFVLAYFGTPQFTKFVLNALALITGFNAINDIWSLFQINQVQAVSSYAVRNDALALAEYTHTPVAMWIVVWIVLAAFMMGVSAYLAFVRGRKQPDPVTTA